MNLYWWLLQFANGNAFFVGIAILLATFTLDYKNILPKQKFIWRIISVVGATFAIVSATPLPLLFYMVWGLAIIAAYCTIHLSLDKLKSYRKSSLIILLLLSLLIMLWEIPYHLTPKFSYQKNLPIYVLGDSISAGLGEKNTWPEQVAQKTQIPVFNLSKAGGTISTAILEAEGIQHDEALILIEIGGNDFFGRTTPAIFTQELEELF